MHKAMERRLGGVNGKAGRVLIACGALALAASGALAQSAGGKADAASAGAAGGAAPTAPLTPRTTLAKMTRPMTLNVKETRLEDVMKFIQNVTQAELEIMWATDSTSGSGLDKEKLVTINVSNRPALSVLEAVLAKAKNDFSESTWQMTSEGTMQVGPKDVLNKSKRLVIYDIHDLLMIIPNYTEVPQIDLTSVLQQGQGGSGQSPFTGSQTAQGRTPDQVDAERRERIQQLIRLIQDTIEPEQWVDNGGEGGTIRAYNNTLIINAPDYMHRQINGYPYWPNTSARVVNGRRYVTLNADTSIGKIDGFAQQPVTGVTGGGGGAPGGGGGGGGGGTPGRGP